MHMAFHAEGVRDNREHLSRPAQLLDVDVRRALHELHHVDELLPAAVVHDGDKGGVAFFPGDVLPLQRQEEGRHVAEKIPAPDVAAEEDVEQTCTQLELALVI